MIRKKKLSYVAPSPPIPPIKLTAPVKTLVLKPGVGDSNGYYPGEPHKDMIARLVRSMNKPSKHRFASGDYGDD